MFSMNKKQAVIFLSLVFILVLFNNVFMKMFVKTSSTFSTTDDFVVKEQVSSQKLFNRTWKIIKNNYVDVTFNKQYWERWREHYKNKIKTDEDAYVAINTMLESLNDPYSRYLSKREFREQVSSIDSKTFGIGVNIMADAGKILIVGVIEGTPASSQLKVNDIILKVNNKDVKGMQIADVADLVRGPENSIVELSILRGEQKLVKKLKRKEIKIKTVKSSVEDNIGYIQIMSFIGITTPNEFIEALEKTQKTEGLIIDLRGNTGGLLPNAIFIANLFIKDGTIVSIVGKDGYRRTIKAESSNYNIEKPTVLLVDEASASASEILSGALKDYHKATIIGTRTFGKGMVQKIIPLPNETGLNLTIAKYLTPSGTDINKKGINPDIEVKLTIEDIKNKEDKQLLKAKEVLNKMIESEKG